MFSNSSLARRRRPALARKNARTSLPAVETMESRQLLTSYVVVDSPSVKEGTGGVTTMNFTVKLLTPSVQTVTVDYGTADRSAVAGQDYVATSGSLTFAPGETVKVVGVPVVTDATAEYSEIFDLKLTRATNGVLWRPIGTGMIVDDDTVVAPKLSSLGVRMTRGLLGSRTMYFDVTLNAAQKVPVTVTASTANYTAVAGTDYQARSETLTFAPGETVKRFWVTIYGTSVVGPDKKFMVNFSNASAPLAQSYVLGTLAYGA